MPKAPEIAKTLRPYVAHGVDLDPVSGSDEVLGECPFCGKRKFYVSIKTGLYQCKVCQTGNTKGGGNALVFLRELHKVSFEATPSKAYDELAEDRGLLFPETLILWDLCKSRISGEWLVPGYSYDGKLHQLYRYRPGSNGKMVLLPTPGVHEEGKAHGLHGVNLVDATKQEVYVLEGPWDGMAAWECLRGLRPDEGGHLVPSGESSSLLQDACVIAVPGAGGWQESWSRLLAGKDVILLYDSDHPLEQAGKTVPPAGWTGMRRVCTRLSAAETPPRSVRIVRWGPEGYDPEKKSGYDVRDELKAGGDTIRDRAGALHDLLGKLEVPPEDWVAGRSSSAKSSGTVSLDPLPCGDWRTVRTSWLKAMKWTDGLDYALTAMLACASSTDLPGTPAVWLKIIGPPACGKSTLCEALSVTKRFVRAESVITGFHSGWKTDAKGEEDHSLLSKLNGKTLITKDGDTLLQSANKQTILSEARDLYDGVSRVHYRHGMNRQYENLLITWLLCGTESLRGIDESELGERFLDIVIMEGIDPDLEEEINARVAGRQLAAMRGQSDGDDHEVHMSKARRLTAGYLEYLRDNNRSLLAGIDVSEEVLRKISTLSLYVAHLRARPSKNQAEHEGREMSNRLTGQLTRLALCLAMVLNKTTVDEEVFSRVRRCATDTARGVTSKACSKLDEVGVEGATAAAVAARAEVTDVRARELLKFLQRIKVVESFDWTPVKTGTASKLGGGSQKRWRLTPRMRKIYREVAHAEGK
jgi:hypothetical protein